MKVVILTEWFAEKMGYTENLLPKALANEGIEVHVVTSDLQPNFPDYEKSYEPFLGPRQQPIGTKQLYGYTLHRLSHGSQRWGIQLKGLEAKLLEIKPDIVQAMKVPCRSTLQIVALKRRLKSFRLFMEEHTHWSVFKDHSRLHRAFYRTIFAPLSESYISHNIERCYAIAPDVATIAHTYFGIELRKLEVCPLGVDTTIFKPAETADEQNNAATLRKQLGFNEDDIVCIYSGRFTEGKNPACLAKAILLLQEQDPRYKAVFVGNGKQDYIDFLQSVPGCKVVDFVQWFELATYYRMADIGVWPSQESLSQLDCAACGKPIIISSLVHAKERTNGNGLHYEDNNPQSLADCIQVLADKELNKQMGALGAQKIQVHYSWQAIAQKRIKDYEMVLEPAH